MIGYSILYPLLIHNFGPQSIPYLYLGIAIVSLLSTMLHLVFLRVTHVEWLMEIFCALSILGLILNRFFILPDVEAQAEFILWRWGLYIFFVLFAFICSFTVIPLQIWTSICSIILPSQRRRFYNFFFLSIILGRIIGSYTVSLSVLHIGMQNLAFIWMAGIAALMPCIFLLFHRYKKSHSPQSVHVLEGNKSQNRADGNFKQLFNYIKKTDIAKIIILSPMFFWMVNLFVESQYAKILSTQFTSVDSLSQYYGLYFGFRNITIVVGVFILGPWFIQRIGLIRSIMIVPFTALIGFILITVKFEFIEGLMLYFFFDVAAATLYVQTLQLSVVAIPTSYREAVRGLLSGGLSSVGTILGVLIYLGCQAATLGGNFNIYVTNGAAITVVVMWLILLIKGKKIYIEDLLSNIKHEDDGTIMDAIELLEERKEPKAYEVLLTVLSDETGRYTVEMKGATMRMLVKLGWLRGVRSIFLYLDHKDPRLRLYAISSLMHFKNISNNIFAVHTLVNKLQYLSLYDSFRPVRIAAAKFLMELISKEELLVLMDRLYNDTDPRKRVLMIQSVRMVNQELVDLLLLEGLKDSDPSICSEVLISLNRYLEYSYIVHDRIRQLLASDRVIYRIEGLRTLIITTPTFNYLPEITAWLKDPEPAVRCLAGIAYLSSPFREETQSQQALEIAVIALLDSTLSRDNKDKIAALFASLRVEVIDELVDAIQGLTSEKRMIAFDSIGKFGLRLEEKYEEDVHEIDLSNFIGGLKFGS